MDDMELSFDLVFEQPEENESENEPESGRLTPIRHLIPVGFTRLVRGIYRSGFPDVLHLDIYEELRMKSICSLTNTEYSMPVKFWIMRNSVNKMKLPILSNNDHDVETPHATIDYLLRRILDPQIHPVVIHCDTGARQAACVVGCFRKLQGWNSRRILKEYQDYPGVVDGVPASLDIQYILDYRPSREVQRLAYLLGISTRRPAASRPTSIPLPDIIEEE